jgi:hypothetical protein
MQRLACRAMATLVVLATVVLTLVGGSAMARVGPSRPGLALAARIAAAIALFGVRRFRRPLIPPRGDRGQEPPQGPP